MRPFILHTQRRIMLIVLVAITLLISSCGGSSQTTQIVAFSDVHFNPFYDATLFDALVAAPADEWETIFEGSGTTTLSTWGQEANYPLLKQTITTVCTQADEAPFLLFTGDILGHGFNNAFYALYGSEDETALRTFILKTVTFFAQSVRSACGERPVAFILGNNDAYEGDYQLLPGSTFLADTANLFSQTLLMNKVDATEFAETYVAGGYYATTALQANLMLIGMNTVFFSPRAPEESAAAASVQIAWLETKLAQARANGLRVWLLLHIPPGIDIFSTVHTFMDENGHVTDAATMWTEELQAEMAETLTEYRDVISATFGAHTHMDEYRLSISSDTSPHGSVVVTPSISPLFGNNPAFKVLTARTDDWLLSDYTSWVNPLEGDDSIFSTSYTFSNAYEISLLLDNALAVLTDELATDSTQRATYIEHYYSGHDDSNPIDDTNWSLYRCGISQMTKSEFMTCVNDQ